MILQAELASAKSRIVQIIDSCMPLKKRGTTWWTRCPFHSEQTASFAVSESKGRFKCFSCGVSGDAIDFVRMFYKTDFRGASAILGLTDGTLPRQVAEQENDRKASKQRRKEIRTEWHQLAAGLRYMGRLIANTGPLERESDWFTAELMLNDRLDELEVQLR